MRGIEGALYVLSAVRRGAFASEELRRIGAGVSSDAKGNKIAMAAPDLMLASSLVYIVQRRRELWQTILEGFLGRNKPRRDSRSRESVSTGAGQNSHNTNVDRGFDSLPAHVQDCLLVGAGGLLELRHFASAVLVNALLNELREKSQANGERRERWVPLVNAVLHGVSERGPECLEALRKSAKLEERALWAGVPVWSIPAWSRTWSRAEINRLFELLPQAPASSLRVLPGHREEVLKSLERAEFEVADAPAESTTATIDSEVIRLKSTILPTSVPGFQDGLVTVQSEGSILITSLVKSTLNASGAGSAKAKAKVKTEDGQHGMFVLDICSGRGVKAGQILQDCTNIARLECWELSEGRHRAAKREIARLAIPDPSVTGRVTLKQGDARKLVPGNTENNDESERPDFVLLDAPCSGSGTWNRKPDSKWRLDWEQLDRLVATQKNLLERAVTLARNNGGVVLYITCSLLKQENESVVAEVLSRHPECTEIPVNFSGLTGSSASILHKGKPWGTYIWPETPWLDGFYCALILKR